MLPDRGGVVSDPSYISQLRACRRPALSAVASLLTGVVVSVLLAGTLLFTLAALGLAGAGWADEALTMESTSVAAMVGGNLLLAAGIPAALIAVWVGYRRHPGIVHSVSGRIRWHRLATGLVVAGTVVCIVLTTVVMVDGSSRFDPPQNAGWMIVAILLTTPLQAAGEEYVFRGWLSQVIGSWFGRAVIGSLVAAGATAVLFGLAHGQQDGWLFADRFIFGLAMSWLVARTGGIEAAVAAHAANNVVALVLVVLTGQLSASLNATSGDISSLIFGSTMTASMTLALLGLNRVYQIRSAS